MIIRPYIWIIRSSRMMTVNDTTVTPAVRNPYLSRLTAIAVSFSIFLSYRLNPQRVKSER